MGEAQIIAASLAAGAGTGAGATSGSHLQLVVALTLALGVALGIALWYWLLIVTEGAYLGPGVVRWLYDRGADTYDDIKGFSRPDEVAVLGNPLLHRLEASAGPKALVLDVATGTCRLPLALLDIPFFEGEIVGLDTSRRMLDVGAQKTAPWSSRLHLVHHDAVPLPFAPASFDAVTLLEALEFLPDRSAALREMVRVLRPGGWMLVTNRIGVDSKLMPGKVDSPERFEERLREMELTEIRTQPWQSFYSLVWAKKTGTGTGVSPADTGAGVSPADTGGDVSPADTAQRNAAGWPTALSCPFCRADGQWRTDGTDSLICEDCGGAVTRDGRIWEMRPR